MSNRPLDHKLDQLRNLIAAPPSIFSKPVKTVSGRYQRLARALGSELVSTNSGSFCLKTTILPFTYEHGSVVLDQAIPLSPWPLSAFTAHEVEGQVHHADLLYLDTETTGLGGAGIVPFLVGVGRVTRQGLEVRQFVIPDYSDESAMLETLLEELQAATLVTYNGAAFDLPVLRDRFIINRLHRNLAFDGNIDLLQATRRLFRRRIKDCSLKNVEREIFGFLRTDDIPGYLVPSIYFDWLTSENISQLPGVLEHNLYDIVSLHFLAAHIAHAFQTEGDALWALDDVYSLSRVYHRRNDRERTSKLCSRIDGEATTHLPADIRLFQAFALKKSSRLAEAALIFLELSRLDSREGYWANLELSKYYEHCTGEFNRSLDHARRARTKCPCCHAEKERLDGRISRLQTRLAR